MNFPRAAGSRSGEISASRSNTRRTFGSLTMRRTSELDRDVTGADSPLGPHRPHHRSLPAARLSAKQRVQVGAEVHGTPYPLPATPTFFAAASRRAM